MSVTLHIKKHLNQPIDSIQSIASDINLTYQVTLKSQQLVFIKYQSHKNNVLLHEAKELQLLGKTVCTPKVIASCEQCLILEWIPSDYNPNVQAQMGAALANLHRNTSDSFGFDFDNKIGQTPQRNAVGKKMINWPEFYWEYRLLYQIKLAYQSRYISKSDYQNLLKIERILPHLFDSEIPPTLLHGDLWSGNVISGKNNPYFIDTASYYGHREADFALTFMFGGFNNEFYRAYSKIYPLDDGFNQRKPLYMLYHYLNHLNIFGTSYHANTMHCVKQLLTK